MAYRVGQRVVLPCVVVAIVSIETETGSEVILKVGFEDGTEIEVVPHQVREDGSTWAVTPAPDPIQARPHVPAPVCDRVFCPVCDRVLRPVCDQVLRPVSLSRETGVWIDGRRARLAAGPSAPGWSPTGLFAWSLSLSLSREAFGSMVVEAAPRPGALRT